MPDFHLLLLFKPMSTASLQCNMFCPLLRIILAFCLNVVVLSTVICRINDVRPTGKNTQLLDGTTVENR